MNEIPCTDAHTHCLPEDPSILACVNLPFETEKLPAEGKNYLFSLGIHPAESLKENGFALLRKSVQRFPSLSAIGECGLDKNVPVAMEKQKALFLRQAELAEELKKPLIVHCVKAWDILYDCAKRFPAKGRKWLIHSFRGNFSLAQELVRHSFTLSLAPPLIRTMPERAAQMRELPFLLETDDAQEDLKELFVLAAKSCKIPGEELKKRVRTLFGAFFQLDTL
ncbi:MAG: TatD family hydrolase [Lentisphaeria bacterium]|nr:TatD family hydrolase [Lentisphaeria bacterium]